MNNYRFKNNIKINKSKFADDIGYSRQLISNIFNGKKLVRKAMAFHITKTIDLNANIEDYFEEIK